MKLFLGVDGGQSGTTAVIGDETGRILGAGEAGPCNHATAAEGRAKLERAVSGSLAAACAAAGLDTVAGSSPAAAQAAARLPETARSSFARPSAAVAWLHGPASPAPRIRPVSSPITAVVPDWPPSTPRKSFMAIGRLSLLYIRQD